MSSERYTPLPEVHNKNGRISLNVNLPGGLNTSHMGVDVEQIANAMDMGGISTLNVQSIATRYRSYGTVNSPEEGAATRGLSLTDEKTEVRETSLVPGEPGWRNFKWINLKTTIDVEQIDLKINETDIKRKEAVWAKILDKHLRRSIRSTGVKHLLTGFDGSERAFAFALSSGYLGIIMDLVTPAINDPLFQSLTDNATRNLIIGQSIMIATAALLGRELAGKEENGKGYRFNLIPGLELDRALVLLVATAKPNSFVKPAFD